MGKAGQSIAASGWYELGRLNSAEINVVHVLNSVYVWGGDSAEIKVVHVLNGVHV